MPTKFRIARGSDAVIQNLDKSEGLVYFATDSGKIYYDVNSNDRIIMGGSGVAIHYGQAPADLLPDEDYLNGKFFPISIQDHLENPKELIAIEDLVFNNDGTFYKVWDKTATTLYCEKLAVAGGGGGGGVSTATVINVKLETPDNINLINGQPVSIKLTGISATETDGSFMDPTSLTLSWQLEAKEGSNWIVYKRGTESIPNNQPYELSFGDYLRPSATSRIVVSVSGINSGESRKKMQEFTASELTLTKAANFSNLKVYDPNNVNIQCNVVGNMVKVLKYYFDDILISRVILPANAESSQLCQVPSQYCTHGAHSVRVELYQGVETVAGSREYEERLGVDPIVMEIAVKEANISADEIRPPIIWLGEYKENYYNYDDIRIPYLVYDPKNSDKTTVRLWKNGLPIEGGERSVPGSQYNAFNIFEITDAEQDIANFYSISCGEGGRETRRNITFYVEQDPNRRMEITKSEFLKLSFDARGRSNDESLTSRSHWEQTIGGTSIQAQFENFNWLNNGWKTEPGNNNETCLRISNGAKFYLPIGPTQLSSSSSANQSWTYEMQFKIRNVQDYSELIQNITRYKDDQEYYEAFSSPEQTTYTNYDAFLAWYLSTINKEYDSLEFDYVYKKINLSKVACGYYSGNQGGVVGFCFGTQDAFFSNGTNTVSAAYVEDEMVYLSMVYSYQDRRIYIYINGMLTGAINASSTNPFTINSQAIVFNSEFCDIDLFKFRIYNTPLTVYDIVMNHAVDTKDINIYDLCETAVENPAINEFQLKLGSETEPGILKYNATYPHKYIMPYIIFDATKTSANELSWSKSVDVPISVTFKNTGLDYAYASGALEELAIADGLCAANDTAEVKAAAVKNYYLHHCPSFVGNNINMAVQGTSSEFYPRRNYKLKTQTKYDADKKKRVHMWLNAGPYEDDFIEHQMRLDTEATTDPDTGEEIPAYVNPCHTDWFYMNNYDVGTTKFTMKIDFMESSGSYNGGFCRLVHNAYSKHPLNDYINKNAVTNANKIPVDSLRTNIDGFPVLAFHKRGENDYQYIGRYNMLLDKGSDEAYGFKTHKDVGMNFLGGKAPSKVAECWEFSDNSRTFCSFRDPEGRKELSFEVPPRSDEKVGTGNTPAPYRLNSKQSAPIVCDSFEYRYNDGGDVLDYFYDPVKEADKRSDALGEYPPYKFYEEQLGDGEEPIWVEVKDKNHIATLSTASESVVAKGTEVQTGQPEPTGLFNYQPQGSDVAITYRKVKNYDIDDLVDRNTIIQKYYKNWEKLCKWVWSTCTDVVPSQGEPTALPLGEDVWESGKFYFQTIPDPIDGQEQEPIYILDDGENFDDQQDYYNYVNGNYVHIILNTMKYEPTENSYYIKVNDNYVLVEDDAPFDSSVVYYAIVSNETDLANKARENKVDRLVEQCTEDEVFNPDIQYYTYDSSAPVNCAVTECEVDEETFNANKTQYYKGTQYTFGGKAIHKYDTKEYRNDKFKAQLAQHFDIEYLSTYFVMTEIFECYDSRGKNCMMASWGPQVAGGDYIWYPIFYDLDTQLGINNTGIPSFTYSVDASEAGNFSTSDSVLWNNFYANFKDTHIIQKYRQLKGETGISSDVGGDNVRKKELLKYVDTVEKWYNADPQECGWRCKDGSTWAINYAMTGQRPLIALNLDEYYKFLTIYNSAGTTKSSPLYGMTGRIDGEGKFVVESTDYLYALQGDRSLSRRQFLSNRIQYLDSWLNVGNFARGGANRLWGRIQANNANISDFWVENPADPDTSYWLDGAKRNEFDAEYWLTLTPIHDSYVTLGADNENWPSQKFSGKPLRFNIDAVEKGFRTSNNYKEQLLYVYGINQMRDLGDLSKSYWTEFKIEGDADRLTRLKLGHDAYMTDNENNLLVDGEGKYIRWYNLNMNQPSLPANGLPLLKEMNFCNITINRGGHTIDLSKSEKLENFRATGSNLEDVQFAEGVALNTLYLPPSVTKLDLAEARSLTNIIESYTVPTKNAVTGEIEAAPGLYIQNLTDLADPSNGSVITNIKYLSIVGDHFGYDSYVLLDKYYRNRSLEPNVANQIQLTDVKWSPFIKLTEDDVYDATKTYKKDNGHYGLEDYVYDSTTFNYDARNGEIYVLDESVPQASVDLITNDQMLRDFISENCFNGVGADIPVPQLTGIMYIKNTTPVDELDIKNTLVSNFPNLTLFFENVDKVTSGKFILPDFDDNGTYLNTYSFVSDGHTTEPSVQKISPTDGWFSNPYSTYTPEKPNYDFLGWSSSLSEDDIIGKNAETPEELETAWQDYYSNLELPLNQDYVFYALFKKHEYEMNFYSNEIIVDTFKIQYGKKLENSKKLPAYSDNSLTLTETYRFVGWSENPNQFIVESEREAKLVNFELLLSVKDYNFYACYVKEDVHKTTTNLSLFSFRLLTNELIHESLPRMNGYCISPASGVSLSGKITLPTKYLGTPVVAVEKFYDQRNLTHVFWSNKDEPQLISFINNSAFGEQGAFSNCSSLAYFEMPPTVKAIAPYSFQRCPLSDDFTINDGCEIIFNNAFSGGFGGMTATELYIPGSVRILDRSSFGYVEHRFNAIVLGNENDPTQIMPGQVDQQAFSNNAFPTDKRVNIIRYYSEISPNDTIDEIISHLWREGTASTEGQFLIEAMQA